MTESQLRKALEKVGAQGEAICSEFIAAGRGFELPSQTRLLADPLALRWRANATLQSELRNEAERRKTWHGSLKKIKA